jgi:hypothetical protein
MASDVFLIGGRGGGRVAVFPTYSAPQPFHLVGLNQGNPYWPVYVTIVHQQPVTVRWCVGFCCLRVRVL